MKILVTGSKGQLGSEIRVESVRYPEIEFLFTDISELDISDMAALDAYVEINKPEFIVNCAAYTAVDKAEDDEAIARRVNVDAVKNLGGVSEKYGIKMIHVSTDYVFDGKTHVPYTEDVATSPAGVYGKTKLDGELVLQEICDDAIVIRTSWLYSSFGNNFVKTMLKFGREREVLTVIYDQIGTPTYANDLARAILSIILSGKWEQGIYHYSNEGVCSWYDFAIEIHSIAGIDCRVEPIESSEYVFKTPRPHYSVLNKKKIKDTFGVEVPYWKDSLKNCIALIEP